jgi:MoxR-like ATPase
MNRNQKKFIAACEEIFGVNAVINRDQIARVVNEKDVPQPYWLTVNKEYREGRGQYRVPVIGGVMNKVKEMVESVTPQPEMTVNLSAQVLQLRQPKLVDESDSSIPKVDPNYVPFGFYNDLKQIIKSGMFYPVFITGPSGNGKTSMVEQICANTDRECIRVNLSIETDESDLLGGPTLIDGNIVFKEGPVITAMRKGSILLLDECDRGSNKLLCLQGIMEGKPHYLKKTGEVIYPAPGFNVIATANTKGSGSDEGKYLAQILDAAFLNRFAITVEQEFPNTVTERKILAHYLSDKDFVEKLVSWSEVIRKSYDEGAIDEVVSTRKLVHIAQAFNIFKDKMKAVTLCVSIYDEETKLAMIDLYSKIDADVKPIDELETPQMD